MIENTLWTERYRPQTIEECILPDDIKETFKSFKEKNDCPNLLLSGRPGMGKTTIAKALCNELDCDYMVINGSNSEEAGISALREKIKIFASTVSLSGGKKIVIIDEADHLNNHVQPFMRSFMEEFSANCRFILTCNYKMKIIDPLISRLTTFDFNISPSDKPKLATAFMKRIISILEKEDVEFDKKVVAEVIKKYFPDFRKTISEFQRYWTRMGKIDVGIMAELQNVSVKELVASLKSKDFPKMRKWVNENVALSDPQTIIRSVFDSIEDHLEPSSIPQAILHLADYAYKAAFVADQELHLSALFIMLMADCQWK